MEENGPSLGGGRGLKGNGSGQSRIRVEKVSVAKGWGGKRRGGEGQGTTRGLRPGGLAGQQESQAR